VELPAAPVLLSPERWSGLGALTVCRRNQALKELIICIYEQELEGTAA
jgi:hypothetical protein